MNTHFLSTQNVWTVNIVDTQQSALGPCYEMDKTSISMFEILEPGGSALGKYSIEGSQFYSIGVPKFYSWVNVISVYVYNDLG